MTAPAHATLAALVIVFAFPIAPVASEELPRQELRALARRASHDHAALQRLLEVERVDGTRVDLRRALQRASAREVTRRLDALDSDVGVTAAESSAVRSRARLILAHDDYRRETIPRPFAGVLRAVGERMRPVLEPVGRFFERAAALVPGGSAAVLTGAAALVVIVSAVVAMRLVRRRTRLVTRSTEPQEEPGADPRSLEREAEAAEQAGDLETALRLLFRAGLLRLSRARVIRFRPSLTTREVARALSSQRFDALAATFDRVVYGSHAPRPSDLSEARSGWTSLLQEAEVK